MGKDAAHTALAGSGNHEHCSYVIPDILLHILHVYAWFKNNHIHGSSQVLCPILWPHQDHITSIYLCDIKTIIIKLPTVMYPHEDRLYVLCMCVPVHFLIQERMISMTLDKDNEVAVQAMKLLILLSKWVFLSCFLHFFCCSRSSSSSPLSLLRSSDDVLTPEDYNQLFQLVYSSQRPLAASAGELVFSRYFYANCLRPQQKLWCFAGVWPTHAIRVQERLIGILLVPFRVLSAEPSSSVTQDEMNDEETCKQQTYARLKALLQFYQESEVITHVLQSGF